MLLVLYLGELQLSVQRPTPAGHNQQALGGNVFGLKVTTISNHRIIPQDFQRGQANGYDPCASYAAAKRVPGKQ